MTREFVERRRDPRDQRLCRPRPRPRVGILDGVLVLDRGRIDERKALGHLQGIGGSLIVGARRLVVEVRRLDNQRVPLPVAARTAQPGAHRLRRMWTSIERNDPPIGIRLREDYRVTRRLLDLKLGRHARFAADRRYRVGVASTYQWPTSRIWMRVVSRLSSNVMGGKMVGMRLASMVLPAPGGPTRSMLW